MLGTRAVAAAAAQDSAQPMNKTFCYFVAFGILATAIGSNDVVAHDTSGWEPLDFVGYFDPFGFDGQNYTDVWGDNDHAFLGSVSSGVAIIDLSNPSVPALAATYDPNATHSYEDIKVHDGVGYFAGGGGVHVVDVSDPQQPMMLSQIDASNGGFDEVQNVFVNDGLLFAVNSQSSTIKVFDVADSTQPTWLRDIRTNDLVGLWDLTIDDDRLYAAGLGGVLGEGAAYIYDISDVRTNNPSRLGTIKSGANTASVAPSGDGQLLVTTQREVGGALSVWDISNLGFPSRVGHATAATYGISSYSAGAVVVDELVVYAAWYEAGAQVLDLDDADGAPSRIGAYETSPDSSPLDGFVGNRSIYTGLGSDRVLLSDTQWGLYIVNATSVLPSSADFDSDGQLTANDIDLLTMEIAAGNDSAEFDITGDSVVSTDDLSAWLTLAGEASIGRPFQFGDANLDGSIDALDLNDLAVNWGQDIDTWTGGDFTADGTVNAADLNVLALNWPTAVAAAVPESLSGHWSLVALVLLGYRRRLV